MADLNPDNFSNAPDDEHIELPDRYIEVGCPQCGHAFEIDLMQWVRDAH
jgi:hypothetical protein